MAEGIGASNRKADAQSQTAAKEDRLIAWADACDLCCDRFHGEGLNSLPSPIHRDGHSVAGRLAGSRLRSQRVYEHVRFPAATSLAFAPGSDRCFVTDQYGKACSLPADRDCREADPFVTTADLVARLNAKRCPEEALQPGGIFHLTFHPDFATNRFCYLCSTVGYRNETRPPYPESTPLPAAAMRFPPTIRS